MPAIAYEMPETREPKPLSVNEVKAKIPPVLSSSADGVKEVQSDPIASAPVENESPDNDPPTFTVAEVKEKWEYIKRRVKTKKDGAMVAALLSNYTVVLVEGTGTRPVIVIKAQAEFHYKAVHKDEDKQKLIEWALKIELGQECRVRLLSPSQAVPSSPLPPSLPPSSTISPPSPMSSSSRGSGSAGTGTAARPSSSPLASATLTIAEAVTQVASPPERPAPFQSAETTLMVSETQVSTASVMLSPNPVVPLARIESVRENTTKASSSPEGFARSGETRQTQIEKKAKVDPVVQEVVRMFKAQIKDVHLK